jgi:hypothetical protein
MHDQWEAVGRAQRRRRPGELLDLAVGRQPKRAARSGEESGPGLGKRHQQPDSIQWCGNEAGFVVLSEAKDLMALAIGMRSFASLRMTEVQ